MDTIQYTLFDSDNIQHTESNKKEGRSRMEIRNDYDGFVAKFQPKKTTDDCYTPPEIYKAVVEWVDENIKGLEGLSIRRPFKPGGDYQREALDYTENDIVVDNPPFSILASIVDFYCSNGIPFFMFAPTLTLFSAPRKGCTYIVAGASVIYENKAIVNTSFITNMEGHSRVIVAGDLCAKLNSVAALIRKRETKQRQKRIYPDEVITAAILQKIANRGISFKVPMDEAYFVRRVDGSPRALFGGGYLISERAAAERAAAERFELSERERDIIKSLSGKL